MVEKGEVILALGGMLASTTIILTAISAWSKGRRIARGPSDEAMQRLVSQIEDLHRHLDSVSIDVERIAEGQRFTTKLLAERTEPVSRGQ